MNRPRNAKVDRRGRWRTYPGWTVLFDSFEPALDALQDLVVQAFAPIAPLPARTHHITVCDGVNPGLLRRTSAGRAQRVDRPEVLPARLKEAIRALIGAARVPVEFVATGVERRNSALVLALRPAEPQRVNYEAIDRARRDVLDVLGHHLDVEMASEWRPHVTLGYLLQPENEPTGTPAIRKLDDAARAVGTVRTHGADLYRFESMVDFRRVISDGAEQP